MFTPLDLKKLQNLERGLTALIIFLAVLAPVSFSWMQKNPWHWSVSAILASVVLFAVIGVHLIRQRVSAQLFRHYEELKVGAVLQKKMTAQKELNRFVIINTEHGHFHLKSLYSGEPMLVSKNRVREYFEIEN